MNLKLSYYNKDKGNSFYYNSKYKIGETFLTRKKNLLKEKIEQIKKGIIKNDRKTEN